jgi:hypothetical protein
MVLEYGERISELLKAGDRTMVTLVSISFPIFASISLSIIDMTSIKVASSHRGSSRAFGCLLFLLQRRGRAVRKLRGHHRQHLRLSVNFSLVGPIPFFFYRSSSRTIVVARDNKKKQWGDGKDGTV